jgi:hypothetical protein
LRHIGICYPKIETSEEFDAKFKVLWPDLVNTVYWEDDDENEHQAMVLRRRMCQAHSDCSEQERCNAADSHEACVLTVPLYDIVQHGMGLRQALDDKFKELGAYVPDIVDKITGGAELGDVVLRLDEQTEVVYELLDTNANY